MADIQFESLNEALVGALPELRDDYQKELDWWKGEKPGSHVIYADILVPRLREALGRPELNESFLTRAFELLERLAMHPDARVQEVAALSALECLADDPRILAEARRRMGPASLKTSIEMENWRPSQ